MSIANEQLEIMGRYMAELGQSPSARARLQVPGRTSTFNGPVEIKLVPVFRGEDDEE